MLKMVQRDGLRGWEGEDICVLTAVSQQKPTLLYKAILLQLKNF